MYDLKTVYSFFHRNAIDILPDLSEIFVLSIPIHQGMEMAGSDTVGTLPGTFMSSQTTVMLRKYGMPAPSTLPMSPPLQASLALRLTRSSPDW